MTGKVIGHREVTGSMVATWDEFLFLEKLKKSTYELSIRKYEIVDIDETEVMRLTRGYYDKESDEYDIKIPETYNGRKIKDYDGEFLYYDNLVKCTEYDDKESFTYKVDCSITFEIDKLNKVRIWFEKTKTHCKDHWSIDFEEIKEVLNKFPN